MPQNDPNATLFSSIVSNDPEGMAAALEAGADPNAPPGLQPHWAWRPPWKLGPIRMSALT